MEVRRRTEIQKTLIVGFSGNYMRLMVPTYRVLCNLDPERTDLLLLSDPKRAGFMQGLEGLGSGVEAIEDWLEDFLNGERLPVGRCPWDQRRRQLPPYMRLSQCR